MTENEAQPVENDEQHDEHTDPKHVRCPRCGAIVVVTPNGNYRKHESVNGKVCSASTQTVPRG